MKKYLEKETNQLITTYGEKVGVLPINKNIIEIKKDKISNSRLIDSFNPGSAQQKQEFFNYYGIESESETKTGNPQWNREELEKLQQLLNIMIKDKE